MAAKVGTGIVAELGSMRISDEIDALEVMGISGITFLCATRLLAALAGAAVRLPVLDRRRLLRQLSGRRAADRRRLLGRLLPDLLAVPEPAGPLIQPDQGDGDGDGDRARRLLLRLQRQRRPGRASAPRRPSRWSSTSSRSISSECSAPSSSGAPTREHQSEADTCGGFIFRQGQATRTNPDEAARRSRPSTPQPASPDPGRSRTPPQAAAAEQPGAAAVRG